MVDEVGCFWRGGNTLRVPMSMHAELRQKLVKKLKSVLSDQEIERGVVLLEGGSSTETLHNDTDHEYIFRQESFFHYLFGVKEPDFYGAICLRTGETTLFAPRLSEHYQIWMGTLKSLSDFQVIYQVDCVRYTDDLDSYLKEFHELEIHILCGNNSDSGNEHSGISGIKLNPSQYLFNKEHLHSILTECRLIKTKKEIEVIRYANKISSLAHEYVMKNYVPGSMQYQLEAAFLYYCYFYGGCRHSAYTCICATGVDSSILHYGHAGTPNCVQCNDNDIFLLDMGAEYHRYASDITRSWPASGKFNDKQRAIYMAVWNAQRAVLDSIKPNVLWPDMHHLALKVVGQNLLNLGLIKGSMEELEKNNILSIFMPHGIGHLLGIDTHDVGGFNTVELKGKRFSEPQSLRTLRCGRRLEVGMVITVEPGIYFNWEIIKRYMSDEKYEKFFVKSEIEKYKYFGGIRIEDNVVITENGCENLTLVPSRIEDLEKILEENRNLKK